MAAKNIILTTLARVFVVEAIVGGSVYGVWSVVLELGQPIVILVVFGLRLALEAAHLRALLEPVRAWQLGDRDDAGLRAADRAMTHAPRRFLLGSVVNWAALLGLALALANLGVGVAALPGIAELSAGLLMILSGLLSLPVLLGPVVEHALGQAKAEVSAVALERKLPLERPRESLARVVVSSVVLNVCAYIIGIGAVAGTFRVRGAREVAVSEQQRRVEVAAVAVSSRGSDDLAMGVGLRTVNELPELLATAEPDEAGVRGGFDARAEVAWAAAPVTLANGEVQWIVASVPTPLHGLEFTLILLFIAGLIALPAFVGAASSARAFAQPLEALDRAARQFVEQGKLTGVERVAPMRNDEVGSVATSFNAMLDRLDELAAAAKTVAEGDLRVDLSHPGELHGAFRGMVTRLREVVVQIREVSLDLAGTAAEIHASTQAQASAAQLQSDGAREASASVSSLAEAAQNITAVAATVQRNAERALKTNDAMIGQIAELRRQAAGVAELLGAIHEVADRSDLLALNGSLEAVRAGEAGRGFGLVAGEMRRLAERVTGTVEHVSELITQIETAGSLTVMAAEASRALVESTAEGARDISTVTARQDSDTKVVSQTIHEVSDAAIASASALVQTRAASEGLRLQAEALERLTAQFETE